MNLGEKVGSIVFDLAVLAWGGSKLFPRSFLDPQKLKSTKIHASAEPPNITVQCKQGGLRIMFCDVTSHDRRKIIVDAAELNERGEDCVRRPVAEEKQLAHLGDTLSLPFAPACGNPVRLDLWTNLGAFTWDLN